MLHIRVDDETNIRATAALATMGMTVSDAVRLFLHRVVLDQTLPMALKVPNKETLTAMAEADEIVRLQRQRFANADELFADLEKNSHK
jgi:DNA-damage-inducible protein J